MVLIPNVRNYWDVESFHWSLDVVYNEDFQAKPNKNGVLDFNTLSKCAISLLVEEKSFKKSKPLKQQRAFMNRDYRELIVKYECNDPKKEIAFQLKFLTFAKKLK